MNKKNYQVGLLITGDAKKGVRATELTRDSLKDLSRQQKKTASSTRELREKTGALLGGLGKVVGVVGGVTASLGGMGALMRGSVITEMKVMADTLNISTQALSEWSVAGEKFNVGGEKMVDIFKDLQDKIGDFASTGGGEAKDIFEKLNLNINDFVGLSADKQLLKIGEALDNVASHSEKIFFMEALANDASRLIPLLDDGAKSLKAAQVEARLLGTSISDIDAEIIATAGREFQRTGDIVTGLGNTLTAKLAPGFAGINDGITNLVVGFGGWDAIVERVIDNTIAGIGFLADHFKTVMVLSKTVEFAFTSLGIAGIEAFKGIGDTGIEVVNAAIMPFKLAIGGLLELLSVAAISVGKFTGNDGLVSIGTQLKNIQGDVFNFNVSMSGLDKTVVALKEHQKETFDEIQRLQNVKPSQALKKWHNDVTTAAEENAKATVAVKEAQRELGQKTASQNVISVSSEVDKLIEGADDLSASWSSAGSVIIDTFGSIGQQLDKLAKSQKAYAKELVKLGQLKEKYKDNPSELKKLARYEEELASTRTTANLSSYASIAGASSKMFSEQSKAREALHKMEQVFTAFEIALSLKKAGANALAAITNQGNGDPYSAFARIAAMSAIMVGLGVFSGGVSGTKVSSAQRQETQGTGTLLGSDEKSNSLANSFDRIEELELDQYAELIKMNQSLRDLNSNISNLAISLVGSYGKFDKSTYTGELGTKSTTSKLEGFLLTGNLEKLDPTGIFSGIVSGFKKTKKSLVDSGISIVSQSFSEIIESGLVNAQAYYDIKTKKSSYWGLSSKTKYSTTYQDIDESVSREFALIFGSIGETINHAVDVLGVDVTRSLENFVINIPNLSLKDLSADEIQQELQAVFSQQADLMATYLVPQVVEFQKAGEGLYETLVRLSQEQAVFNSVLEITTQSLASVDKNQQIAIAQSIIEFAGSIEALQSAASSYFENFFSETEQFNYLQKQLNEQFSALGVALPTTRDEFKSLISGLDLTTENNQRLYSQLLLLAPQMDSYLSSIEKQSESMQSFSEQLERMSMTPLAIELKALQKEFSQYYQEAKAYGADTLLIESVYATKRKEIIDNALQGITSSYNQSVNELVSGNDRLVSSFNTLKAGIANSILSIRRQSESWSESNYQAGQINDFEAALGKGSAAEQLANLGALEKAYVAKYNAEVANINAAKAAAQSRHDSHVAQINERYQLELDAYNNIKNALESLKQAANDLLLSNFSTLTNEQRLSQAQSQFETLLGKAKLGDSDAISQLTSASNSYLTEAQSFYASGSSYQAIFDQVRNALSDLGEQTLTQPAAPTAPPVPREISTHNAQLRELQSDTLEKLTELKALTDELEQQTQSEFDLAMTSLNQLLQTNSDNLLSKVDSEINAINALAHSVDSIDFQPVINVDVNTTVQQSVVNREPTANDNNKKRELDLSKYFDELKFEMSRNTETNKQIAQSQLSQAQHLQKVVAEGNRLSERQFDELQDRKRAL